jgi:hypothetical protein
MQKIIPSLSLLGEWAILHAGGSTSLSLSLSLYLLYVCLYVCIINSSINREK